MAGLAHFGDDGEESRSTRVCEDNRRHGADGFGKGWVGDNFEVRNPGSVGLWCRGRAVLDANGNDHDED